MKPIPYRVQLRLVAAGYAAVLAIAVALIVARYLQYVLHPKMPMLTQACGQAAT